MSKNRKTIEETYDEIESDISLSENIETIKAQVYAVEELTSARSKTCKFYFYRTYSFRSCRYN